MFGFIIHLWIEDAKGVMRYRKVVKNDIGPIDCNQSANIGQDIDNEIQPTSIDDIIRMDVDLKHQWYDHQNCQSEWTRITFN